MQRVYREDNNTNAIIAESKRVEESLEKAFLVSGGNAFGEVRLMGAINGTQGFLCGVIAELFDLSTEEHKKLLVEAVSVFARQIGYNEVKIHETEKEQTMGFSEKRTGEFLADLRELLSKYQAVYNPAEYDCYPEFRSDAQGVFVEVDNDLKDKLHKD